MNGWTIAKILLAYEGGMVVRDNMERWKHYKSAREYADLARKPLLMVGMPRQFWQPQSADVILDIDPLVETIEGGIMADERDIPFPDKFFGACYNAHTLEHMFTVEDCEIAINECTRVSDLTTFVCPSPYSIYANFFCPSHHLRLWFDQINQRIKVTDNRFNTGMGLNTGGGYETPNSINQALVVHNAPEIVKIGSAYILGDTITVRG